MAKSWISWNIERNGSDVALVEVVRITDDGVKVPSRSAVRLRDLEPWRDGVCAA